MSMHTSKRKYAGDYDAFGYNHERSQQHERILDALFSDAECAKVDCTGQLEEPPVYMALWGGANSAKNTVCQILINRGCFSTLPVIFGMEAFDPLREGESEAISAAHPEKEPYYREEFYDLMMKAVMRAQDKRISIIVDDHGDEVSEYQRHLSYIFERNSTLDEQDQTDTILMGHAIEPDYWMWYMMDKKAVEWPDYVYDPTHTPKAISQFHTLSDSWEQLVPLFDCAVMNEVNLNLKNKIERIGVYEHGEAQYFDQERYNQTVTAWKGTNPNATCKDDLWPEKNANAFAHFRRGMGYSPEADCSTSDKTPEVVISGSSAFANKLLDALGVVRSK